GKTIRSPPAPGADHRPRRRPAGRYHHPVPGNVSRPHRGGSVTLRTLIVDDEPLARQRLRRLLEADPDVAIVGESGDGGQALADLRDLRPDLVFLDVQMPVLDGFGVLQALGDLLPPVVIFVTAHDRYALKAFEVHALDYLLKPFDRGRFTAALERA